MTLPVTTTVVNLREDDYDEYMGRAGHGHSGFFGNPFHMGTEGRTKCIARFKVYFLERIAKEPEFKRRVLKLRGKRLGCFCKPEECHADVYADYLNAMSEADWRAACREVGFDPDPPRPASERLRVLHEDGIGDCRRCGLHVGRKNIVFGVGNPDANLMFVGEGPGADEDEVGEPFVGKAGKLLDQMIEAMGLRRSDVWIGNTVKCRPTVDETRSKNRPPTPEERAACGGFLHTQIDIIKPQVIVALGAVAARFFFPDMGGIMSERGKWRQWGSLQGKLIDLMPTYHPAFLLRDPRAKKPAWKDLQAVMKRLDGVA